MTKSSPARVERKLKATRQFAEPRSKRTSFRAYWNKIRAGKMAPVLAEYIGPSESGVLRQRLSVQLEPIMGRLLTPVYAEMTAIFVPLQAIDQLRHGKDDPYAGLTEVLREKLTNGRPLFKLIQENSLTQRMGITPQSIGGVKKLSASWLIGMNAAINFARQSVFMRAPLRRAYAEEMPPAILSETALDRLNMVLDPDDRIDGTIEFDLPKVNLPIYGLAMKDAAASNPAVGDVLNRPEPYSDVAVSTNNRTNWASANSRLFVRVDENMEPELFARFNGTTGSQLSLRDFFRAEEADRIARVTAEVIEADPVNGETKVLRWAYGLEIDMDRTPFMLAKRTVQMAQNVRTALDASGLQSDVLRSDLAQELEFAVPVPKSELGGYVYTFLTIRPDEAIADQPHPFAVDAFAPINYLAESFEIEPKRVTVRDVDASPGTMAETQLVGWGAHNGLKKNYSDYGVGRNVSPSNVEARTSIWRYRVPVSVAPTNVLYPVNFDATPFAVTDGNVASYTIESALTLSTPLFFGPDPVERVSVIDREALFNDVED